MSVLLRGLATADIFGFVRSAKVLTKSADYTVTDDDMRRQGLIVYVTTSSSNRTITLPTAADNTHRRITVKKADSGTGTVIVDGESSETIDGATTVVLYKQYESVTLVCDGTGWLIESAQWASGSYTLNATSTVKFTSVSDIAAYFVRISKDRVKCYGQFNATNADAQRHRATLAIPMGGNFASDNEGLGLIAMSNGGASDTLRSQAGILSSSSGAQTMLVTMYPNATSAVGNYMFEFTYLIK